MKEEIPFEEWVRKQPGWPIVSDGQGLLIWGATTAIVCVIGFYFFEEFPARFFIGWLAIAVGSAFSGSFRNIDNLRKTWYANTETRIQRPKDEIRKLLGRFPDRQKLKEYCESHLYFRPPYCHHPEVAHCKDCPVRRVKTTRNRSGNTVFLGEEIRDCRGHDPIETPYPSFCTSCKFRDPHRFDEFHDCGRPFCDSPEIPIGKNIYLPFYYPVSNACPYWQKSEDPNMQKNLDRTLRECLAWWTFLDGTSEKLDLDETYETPPPEPKRRIRGKLLRECKTWDEQMEELMKPGRYC